MYLAIVSLGFYVGYRKGCNVLVKETRTPSPRVAFASEPLKTRNPTEPGCQTLKCGSDYTLDRCVSTRRLPKHPAVNFTPEAEVTEVLHEADRYWAARMEGSGKTTLARSNTVVMCTLGRAKATATDLAARLKIDPSQITEIVQGYSFAVGGVALEEAANLRAAANSIPNIHADFDYLARPMTAPDFSDCQWARGSSQYAVNIAKAIGGRSFRKKASIAILDYSFDMHVDLDIERLNAGMRYSDHGTKVAGSIAARAGDSQGLRPLHDAISVVGVATYMSPGGVIKSLEYISRHRPEISVVVIPYASDGDWTCVERIIRRQAYERLFVVAAGNSGLDLSHSDTHRVPANFILPNVISVASVTSEGMLVGGENASNWGAQHVHVAAPGSCICTTKSVCDYTCESGTSYAATITGGLAGLIVAAYGEAHPGTGRDIPIATLRTRLLDGDPLPAASRKKISSGCAIDAVEALGGL